MALPFVARAALREEEGAVSEKSNREVVERYVRAYIENDLDAQDQLRHADFVQEFPQSGERIRGISNARAIPEHYPGSLEGGRIDKKALHGSEDRWVVTPVGTLLRITGSGDVYTALFTATYPGETRPWHIAAFVELRDGKILKETAIFGAAFDAPAWRAQWVERT
jgi:ketosteroid isomerase-like protein